VSVDTSTETQLKITITRDRLQENDAYEDLRLTVRYALHFYAMEEARRTFARYERERGVQGPKIQSLDDVLDRYKDKIATKEFPLIRRDIHKVTDQIETEAEHAAQTVGLMGSLATAGISSLALQHQLRQQFANAEAIITSLGEIKTDNASVEKKINELKEALSNWLSRARATNDLFSFMRDPRNIKDRKRYQARVLVDDVAHQLRALARGIPISSKRIQSELFLPSGSIAEWSAVFQNVFTNAFNALVDADLKMIDVSSRADAYESQILVQNTGVPIDLDEAEEFFEPFVRKINISPERQMLGYGGTGLGLTIVRMIANNLGCTVGFVIPEKGYNTAFSLKWREKR
jgi:signal transduction histidine kinase